MRQTLVLVTFCALVLFPRTAFAQPGSLASYWPHEDGREWLYDQLHEELHPPGPVVDNLARLYFDGTTVAPVGITAQVLSGEIISASALPSRNVGVPAEVGDPLLQTLWIARPDLRPHILKAASQLPCPTNAPAGWYPKFLTGGLAYVQISSEVAAWRCNRANTRAWLWLTSELTPGSTATLPLVPDLADDVLLHLTVGELEVVTVPAGTYPDCLRVDYRIDYGQSKCTSDTGEPGGSFRAETAGFVHYAPGIGPLQSLEEFKFSEIVGTCPGVPDSTFVGVPLNRSTLRLRSAPAVPAQFSTWGRLKSAYRD